MTNNGWCRTNYHKDGKRRFGRLSKNGLCCECDAELAKQSGDPAEKSKITRLEQKIVDLEQERERLNSEIKRLRSKLQTLINPIQKSGVTKSSESIANWHKNISVTWDINQVKRI